MESKGWNIRIGINILIYQVYFIKYILVYQSPLLVLLTGQGTVLGGCWRDYNVTFLNVKTNYNCTNHYRKMLR